MVVYFDDILIVSVDQNEHLNHVQCVLEVLRRDKLYINLQKCSFMQKKEFVITSDGVEVDKEKIRAIVERPTPKSLTEVRSFHGLATFYRRLIKNFSSQLAPDCLKQNRFEWTKEAESCFLHLNSPCIGLTRFLKGIRSALMSRKHWSGA